MNYKFKFKHNLSDAEIRSIFVDQMRIHGLIFDSKDLPIIMDGRTRYVKVENRSRGKKNSRSGWYSGRLGDFPNGSFGWLHGKNPKYKWSLYQHIKDKTGSVDFVELTEEQIEKNRIERERDEKNRIRAEKERANFAQAYSIIEWVRSLPLVQHPYLHSKRISIEECSNHVRILNRKDYTASELTAILSEHFPEYNKPSSIRKLIEYQTEYITYRGFNLIMLGRLINQTPQMFQLIFDKKNRAGKNKHFPRDTIKHRTFLNIGKKLESTSEKVITCEGWATGISLLRFTHGELPILICWDSGNMTAVAIEIRHTYHWIDIYSANDNDHTKPLEKNAGVRSGLVTCRSVGAYMLTPPFDTHNKAHEDLSDWNDIDSYYPPSESSAIFQDIFQNAPYITAVYDPGTPLLSTPDNEDAEPNLTVLPTDINWQINWVSVTRLICRGLQFCNYSLEEQTALYRESFKETSLYFEKKNIAPLDRTYDSELNIQLSAIFHKFTVALHCSEIHILHDLSLMGSVLKQLKPLQKQLLLVNLLSLVRDVIAERYSVETANLCIPYHASITGFFTTTKRQWIKEVCMVLFERTESVNPIIASPLLWLSKEEKYWVHTDKNDRINAACDDIQESYLQYDIQTPAEEAFQDQIKRIKFLQEALNQYLIEQSAERRDYLQRITNRFNEVEKTTILIEQICP